MKNLYLMLDNSGSMDEAVGKTTKIEFVKERVLQFLLKSRNVFDEITLYFFAEKPQKIGKFNDVSKAIESINDKYHGVSKTTKIWDCIDKVVEDEIFNNSLLLCITDEEDKRSKLTQAYIVSKLERLSIEFKLLSIKGKKNNKFEKANNIVKTTPENLSKKLSNIKQDLVKHDNSYKINTAVLPLTNNSCSYVDIVTNAMQDIVPYLEELTFKRYYPVPTLLVDDFKYIKEKSIKFREPTEEMVEVVLDITRYLTAVGIVFHTMDLSADDSRLSINFHDKIEDDNQLNISWKNQIIKINKVNLSRKSFMHLISVAESMGFYLNKIIENEPIKNVFFIPEISREYDLISNFFDALNIMIDSMSKIGASINSEIYVGESYFGYHDSDYPNLSFNRDFPKLLLWKKYITEKKFTKLKRCVEYDGKWKKDLNSIVFALKIAIEILRELLPCLVLSKNKYYNIIKTIHTYGMYIPASSNSLLNKHMNNNHFPTWFNLNTSSKVLICLKRLNTFIDKCVKEDPTIDKKELTRKLITAILVHEHTHAIIHEGICKKSGLQTVSVPKRKGTNYRIVNESLAEWSELNFFRGDDEIFNIIMNHIKADNLPDWPYRGALFLENSFDDMGLAKFRLVLDCFKTDYQRALRILKMK